MDLEHSLTPQNQTSMQMTEGQRAMHQVEAQVALAKRFPRDPVAAEQRMLAACQAKSLAEEGAYSFNRGGSEVSGPSIRLAEMMARYWGNLDYGIRELAQREGESDLEAYCWDLESNTRVQKVFTVKHERDKRDGAERLTANRDIYENNANNGARRLRACILSVIPIEIQDRCLETCSKVLQGNQEPLEKRIPKLLAAFEQIGVTKDRIESFLGRVPASMSEFDAVRLRKIYQSIKDNMASVDDWFKGPAARGKRAVVGKSALNETLRKGASPQPSKGPAPKTPEGVVPPGASPATDGSFETFNNGG